MNVFDTPNSGKPYPRISDDCVKFETAAAIQRGEMLSEEMLLDASDRQLERAAQMYAEAGMHAEARQLRHFYHVMCGSVGKEAV